MPSDRTEDTEGHEHGIEALPGRLLRWWARRYRWTCSCGAVGGWQRPGHAPTSDAVLLRARYDLEHLIPLQHEARAAKDSGPRCHHPPHRLRPSGEELMARTATAYNRKALVETLIYHQQKDGPPPYAGGCLCGHGTRPEQLGRSWAEHVADVYESVLTGEVR